MTFPMPTSWDPVSRDASITCDHANRKITFTEGPLSHGYTIRFDTLIGETVYDVLTANQAILLHKAHFFGDNKAFDGILKAKMTKKMVSIANEIAGADAVRWREQEFKVVGQVVQEKFLADLWMYDTLCSSGDYSFSEVHNSNLVVPTSVTNGVLNQVRDIFVKESAINRPLIPPCQVVNTHFATADVDISRNGVYGNPHPITEQEPREVVIEKFKKTLKNKIRSGEISKEQIMHLWGKRLGCTCTPNDCHGHVWTAAVQWVAKDFFAEPVKDA